MSDLPEDFDHVKPDGRLAIFGFAVAISVVVLAALIFDPSGTPPTGPPITVPPEIELGSLDNPAGMASWFDSDGLTASEIELGWGAEPYGAFHNPDYTQPINPVSNGSHPQGQFRIICAPSHFSFDDPVIFPNDPGASHMHMYFGNSAVNADTTEVDILTNTGGSTCQSSLLNRSGYWVPTMFSGGKGADRQIVLPKVITLYYKSHKPESVQPFVNGTQFIAGNIHPDNGTPRESFTPGEYLHWGCYINGSTRGSSWSGIIPGTRGTTPCADNEDIQLTIQFPQCLAVDENGPVLRSDNHQDHAFILYNFDGNYGIQKANCPSTHPYRTMQISYLIRFPNLGVEEVKRWRLSSDFGYENDIVDFPGGSAHADWFAGWNDNAQRAWIDGCVNGDLGSFNCSLGQTGENGTGLRFNPIEGERLKNMEYIGPYLVDDPTS